jgi:hypothetical protein
LVSVIWESFLRFSALRWFDHGGGLGSVVMHEQRQAACIGRGPAIGTDPWVQAAVLQVGDLHKPRQPAGPVRRARDQVHVPEVDAVRARVLRAIQEPQRTQLFAIEALFEQLVFRDRGPLEDLVQPSHDLHVRVHPASDPPDVLQQRGSVLLIVVGV